MAPNIGIYVYTVHNARNPSGCSRERLQFNDTCPKRGGVHRYDV